MFERIADNRNEQSFAVKLRKRRFGFFRSLLARLERPLHVLDIGGTENYWKTMGLTPEDQVFVTLLNVSTETVSLPYLSCQVGDARKIEAADQSFDVVFSNSVIEHVGDYQEQAKMADEVRRVGQRYFVQTPNKYFPLEPHFLFPFFQFMPLRTRCWLVQHFSLGWFPKTPDPILARELVDSIRLLTKVEFLMLFQDGSIYEEKVFGMAKSFVAYGGWDQ